jgi:hypothetical protein
VRSDEVIADRYRLVELIGSGGMGLVWLADDLVENRQIALKRPHAIGGDVRADLEREADIARRIDHPNIVAVYGVVGERNDCWLVMEYFPSTSLAADLGSRSPKVVAAIGAQVADALIAAHAADVVHRDITPGNVLVGADGMVKVTDFGISAWRASTVTSSGKISGTAAYVSPEVANGEGAKAPSDVFSLGATLFAVVEGAPPFGTGDPDVIVARVREDRGTPATQAGPLEPVLAALMRRGREDRPSAAQAKDMLDAVAAGQPMPAWTPANARTASKRSMLIAGAAIGVVAVVLLTFLRPWEPDTGPARTALGFPRTADPCSVADAAALQSFGDATLDAHHGGFNQCDVLIDVDAHDDIHVTYQFNRPTLGVTPQVTRSEPKRDGGACTVVFTLTDGGTLEITADSDARVDTDFCAIVVTAADHAESVLRENTEIPRMPATDPISAVDLYACSMLQPDHLAEVATFANARADAGFADWSCRWQANDGTSTAHVIFDRGDVDSAQEGRLLRSAGRDMYVVEEGHGEGTCVAKVVNHKFWIAGKSHIEMALVVIESDRPMADMCDLATMFAKWVGAQLPTG